MAHPVCAQPRNQPALGYLCSWSTSKDRANAGDFDLAPQRCGRWGNPRCSQTRHTTHAADWKGNDREGYHPALVTGHPFWERSHRWQALYLPHVASRTCSDLRPLPAFLLPIYSGLKAPTGEPPALPARPICSVLQFSSRKAEFEKDWIVSCFSICFRSPLLSGKSSSKRKSGCLFFFVPRPQRQKGDGRNDKKPQMSGGPCAGDVPVWGGEHALFHRLVCSHRGRQGLCCLSFVSRTAEHLHLLNLIQDS